jgi:VanZ family protein
MKKIIKMINAWVPVLFWMVIIFYFSSHKRIGIIQTFVFDFIIFKTLHIIEYAILYYLVYRSYNIILGKNLKSVYTIYAFLISLIYAITDEIHQTFIPTREGRLRDVFIDMMGIGGMMMIINRFKSLLWRR